MAYFTEETLDRYAAQGRRTNFSNIKEASAQADITIFLSHSHKDRARAQGLIAYFDELGVKIYVDWNDKDMPRITNRETADRIKEKIKSHHLFMILATKNALESKWVPWEVGVADQIKGAGKILLIPVVDNSGIYDGSEYLQLYKRVESATDGTYGVFAPGATRGSGVDYFMKTAASA